MLLTIGSVLYVSAYAHAAIRNPERLPVLLIGGGVLGLLWLGLGGVARMLK